MKNLPVFGCGVSSTVGQNYLDLWPRINVLKEKLLTIRCNAGLIKIGHEKLICQQQKNVRLK